MSKEQILLIQPPLQLIFTGPFIKPVNSYMVLKNPSEHRIYFKIKTTAHRSYWVKPKFGVLEPYTDLKIRFTLLPFESNPDKRANHKFMVQSVVDPNPTKSNEAVMWKNIKESDLMESKIQSVLVMSDKNTNTNTNTNEECNSIKEDIFISQDNMSLIDQEESQQVSLAVVEIQKLNQQLGELLERETFILEKITDIKDQRTKDICDDENDP